MAGSNQQSYQPTGFSAAQINPQGQQTNPLQFGGGMASALAGMRGGMGQSQGKTQTPGVAQFGQDFPWLVPQQAMGTSSNK